ncbi:transcriptional regulator [Veronia nyctiphanis]|uniref:Transcriptional regulator n=1 Tax=Veronia nyctiphanis TaxID=1278244 RepID=A0A4Q0YI46_9GAMM|nr:ChrR family anti-sigma-E factor [Veronia nyctiphanis]RXJ70372.1 transcriptional regulator [Veronia nyctiphanis]
MIKFHPAKSLLQAHAAGSLSPSMAIAVSAHCELCEECRHSVDEFSAAEATQLINAEQIDFDTDVQADFSNMLSGIIGDEFEPITVTKMSPQAYVEVGGERYTLPTALRRYSQIDWSSMGGISRGRLPLDEGKTRASLLHIGMNGSVPSHTHKGFELTLLLSGNFTDENGTYEPGDFIMLSGEDHHTPVSRDGCLCYTVANAPLHFTSGVSKLLNTVGRAIY